MAKKLKSKDISSDPPKKLVNEVISKENKNNFNKPKLISGVRSGLFFFISSLVSISILVGVLYAAAPFWFDHLKPFLPSALKDPFDDPRIIAITKKLNAFEALEKAQKNDSTTIKELNKNRLEITKQLKLLLTKIDKQDQSLKSMQKMIQATNPPLDALDTKASLSRLSKNLSYLGGNPKSLEIVLNRIAKLEKDEKKISHITNRLKTLETKGLSRSYEERTGPAIILAVKHLRNALRFFAPFEDELIIVERLSIDNQDMIKAVSILKPFSKKGVKTVKLLSTEFEKIGQKIIEYEKGNTEITWVDRLIDRLKGLITIHRKGESGKRTVQYHVSQAANYLELNDISLAIKELELLKGVESNFLQKWVKNAKARINSEQALAKLHLQAISILAKKENVGNKK